MIIEYLAAHWIEWLFTLLMGFATYGYRRVSKKLQEQADKNEAIAEGVKSLLRESIIASHNKYTDRGYCPIYAKQSITSVYKAYHALGGNDVATDLYNKLLALPEDDG